MIIRALYQITIIQVAIIAIWYAILTIRFIWFYYVAPLGKTYDNPERTDKPV